MKAAALTDKFPYICQHLRIMRKGQKKDICPLGYWNPAVDHPELMVNASEDPTKTVAQLIRTEMFHYAKSNMALVNVYIKDPVVTRIKRDQKIPIIGFVANTGGLLGLCMGFSLVSAFEIVYHCMMTVCWTSFHFYRRRTTRILQKNSIQQESTATGHRPQHNATAANTNGEAERKTSPEMGTISRKLGVDELPPSPEAADLIEDHEHRGRTASRMCSSLYNLKSIPDVTITEHQRQPPIQPHQPRIISNGDCHRFRASAVTTTHIAASSAASGRLSKGVPPPMSLRTCVLIDSKCSLQKYSLQNQNQNPSNNNKSAASNNSVSNNPDYLKRNVQNASLSSYKR